MIPHHFHLIWIGSAFPFVNRLAVESLLQTNPGARVTIHFEDPPPPSHQDWRSLQSKVEFKPIDLTALIASSPAAAAGPSLQNISSAYPAGRSNVLRYLILCREGGIYLDFDTLTLRDYRPLLNAPAFIGEEAVFRCDDDRVAGRFKPEIVPYGATFGLSYYLSYWNCRFLNDSKPINILDRFLRRLWSAKKLNNAVLGAEPGNSFFARALALVPETDAKMRFALGPMLMNRVWNEMAGGESGGSAPETIRRLNSDYFYCIPPSQTYRFFFGPAPKLPGDAFSLHWCSSNHKALAASLSAENLYASKSRALFHTCAREILARGI